MIYSQVQSKPSEIVAFDPLKQLSIQEQTTLIHDTQNEDEQKSPDGFEFKTKINFAYQDDFDEQNIEELESLASVRKSSIMSDSKAHDSSNQATPTDINPQSSGIGGIYQDESTKRKVDKRGSYQQIEPVALESRLNSPSRIGNVNLPLYTDMNNSTYQDNEEDRQRQQSETRLSIVHRNAEKLRKKRKEEAYQQNSLARKQVQQMKQVQSKVQSFNTNYKAPKFSLPQKQNKTSTVSSSKNQTALSVTRTAKNPTNINKQSKKSLAHLSKDIEHALNLHKQNQSSSGLGQNNYGLVIPKPNVAKPSGKTSVNKIRSPK